MRERPVTFKLEKKDLGKEWRVVDIIDVNRLCTWSLAMQGNEGDKNVEEEEKNLAKKEELRISFNSTSLA